MKNNRELLLEIDHQTYPGGFACPLGRLTSRYISMSGPVGVAYERSIKYEKDWHTHEEIDITFPQGAARLEFEEANGKKWTVSSNQFLWMPAEIEHRQKSNSILWDNFALFPKMPTIQTCLKRMDIKFNSKVKMTLAQTHVLARTPLLDDIVTRVFQDRVIAKKRAQSGIIESLIEESLRIILKCKSSDYQLGNLDLPIIDLALRFIESNLFNKISAKSIAEAAHTSIATLYRQFDNEVGMKPLEFQRKRRLDEAAQLIRSGDYLISDIALIVGYQDLASFSKSFKQQFSVTPSKF